MYCRVALLQGIGLLLGAECKGEVGRQVGGDL